MYRHALLGKEFRIYCHGPEKEERMGKSLGRRVGDWVRRGPETRERCACSRESDQKKQLKKRENSSVRSLSLGWFSGTSEGGKQQLTLLKTVLKAAGEIHRQKKKIPFFLKGHNQCKGRGGREGKTAHAV